MATRNLVPRADNEGSLGTAAKRWADIRAVLATIATFVVTTFTAATATITTLIATTATLTNATITLIAGSSTVQPLKYTSGPVNTSPTAGVQEFDGVVFYSTPIANARGLSPSTMFAIVPNGDFNLLTTSGVQSAFPTTNDVWTLAASTSYYFEGVYYITHTTTTITAALAFALAGGASITSIAYEVSSVIQSAANGAPAAPVETWVNQVASTVVSTTSTAGWMIRFKGVIRMNAGGTVTPQIAWSANTTAPVMKQDSYIMFTPIGTDAVTKLGNVG